MPTTLQEIFDKVTNHLRSMKERSEGVDGCMYRAPNGAKCAAGIFIPDEVYKPEMEATNFWSVWKKFSKLKEKFSSAQVELITILQGVHDKRQYWSKTGFNASGEARLAEIARLNDLAYAKP